MPSAFLHSIKRSRFKIVVFIVPSSLTEDLIYVDRTFADEYANSIYTKKLVGALLKVKANMSQGIPQMIEIATSKRWKEDFEHKHKKKAGKGWFRYNTRFALPITTESGEIVEYNTFQAVLIARYSSDKKLYLYDIQNIKKETRYPSWTTRSDGQKPASSEDDYNMSQNELQDKIHENKKETSSPPEQ